MVATAAWRDERQGVARHQGLLSDDNPLDQRHGSSPAEPHPTEHVLLVINEVVAAKSGARLPVWLGVKVPAMTCAVRIMIFPI